MRVWHVIDSLEVGGAETVIATLCREQKKAGLLPSVHCLLRRGKIADDLEAEGVPVHVHGPAPLLEVARRIFRMMRAERPHVLHAHNETPTIFCAPAARAAGVRRVLTTYHGMVVPADRLRPKFWLAARCCDRVVAVSRTTHANLEKSPLSSRRRIVTIYNCAAPAGSSAAFPICEPGEFPVVNVARHVPAKDLATLIRAFAIAREKAPAIVLVLAGGGPLTDSLKQTAGELGVAASVRFLGEQPAVGGILRQSKVFAMSSINEGLPISILEAMSAGLPLVVTAVGGMLEVIEISRAGVAVPPRDPQALAEGLLRFYADENWRGECSARALDCYRRQFTPEKMTSEYMTLYTA